jgi:hypothetical protein
MTKKRRNPTVTLSLTPAEQASLRKQVDKGQVTYGGSLVKPNPLRMGETEKVAIILGLAAGTFALVYYFATSVGKATGAAVGAAV